MKLWSSTRRKKEKDSNSAAGKAESRILSFFDLVTIGLGSSLAVGISVLVGGPIKNIAGPAFVVSVSLAGVTALIGGLCFSDFGVRFVNVNSVYVYSYFWGRQTAAFIFGWILILEYVAGIASAARGIITFIDALIDFKISNFLRDIVCINYQNFFPYFDFLSMGIVIVVTILNASGLKDSINVKKIFTICHVVLVVSIITAGAFKADLNNWQNEQTPDENQKDGFAPFGVLGIVKGAAVAFYGFIGFDRISVSGNEVKKQNRNLPAAVLGTILATFLAYAGVGAVLTLMLPYDKLNAYAAVPFAFQEIGWTPVKWVVAVGTFFGFQTSLFGAMYPLPKIVQAMANDGLLFPCLGNSYYKSKIPVLASVTGGLIAAAAAGIFKFENLVNLTVIGALFVYTVLAINVILLRYSPKYEDDEMLTDSWKNLINRNADVSVKAVVQNYFNFREKHPTDLTGKIIAGNVLLFCVSSVGLGIIFNFFYESLIAYAPEAIAPAGILLIVILFSLISMICQPKSQERIPFKVILIPLLPCLSIFLNIFLMLTLESLTWIIFSSWMAVGILSHFVWRLIKCCRGEAGENSLYEINRTNAVKLNESIWKIKSDKKTFYEGALNPVFSDDLEERFDEINGDAGDEVTAQNEKPPLQLKVAEIIDTVKPVAEERAEPMESELVTNFIRVDSEEIIYELPERDEKVYGECVAEIHTEDEFPQESVALEIVDNTYNFLRQISEDLPKNDVGFKEEPRELVESRNKFLRESQNFFKSTGDSERVDNSSPIHLSSSESQNEAVSSVTSEKTKCKSLRDKLDNEIEIRMNNVNSEDFELKNNSGDSFSEKSSTTDSDRSFGGKREKKQNLVTFREPQKSETISSTDNLTDTHAVKAIKSIPDEQNKVKEFKEKLNQLLKNHKNNDKGLTKNGSLSKSTQKPHVSDINNEIINKDVPLKNVKTLSKSQIRGKLEHLLSKGPPKRPLLRDSFNIKVKETDKDNDLEKGGNERISIQKRAASDGNDVENHFSRSTLQEGIREKILALKKTKEPPEDFC